MFLTLPPGNCTQNLDNSVQSCVHRLYVEAKHNQANS